MRSLTQAYEGLLKDKAIIAAEVMHEYDSKVRLCFAPQHLPPKPILATSHLLISSLLTNFPSHIWHKQFVNPRVNPIRSDACVQTHQSEMVNPFEDD